uniref:Nucleoporin_C domain-containing protein n=1 Tax=Echinostoma caproni TaxID=27848 RepID=A0A183AVS8_9TREM
LKADKISNDFAEKSRGFVSEIDRLGVRRYLDIHKSSSLLLSAKERAESFDALWSKIIKEEVASTQEIMKQLGSWPSRLGYEGILTAHAELGDRVSLIQTLNEACDTLTHWSNVTDKVRQNLPFSNVFLVQLYTKLHCAEAVPGEPCMELLSRLPLTLEPISQSRARDGIKRLLVFGRAEAASELFKRIDPESADDAFLTSLARYATVGGLDSEAISRLWRLADASGARLNMLRRINSNEFRRHNTKVSDMFVRLQESFSKKDVEGIFQAIESKRTEASATIYNHAIPQLLALGLKPTEILERIKPESVRPAAAFGCLLGTLAPLPKEGDKVPVVDLKAADALLQSLKNQNLLPYTDFVSISPFVCRRLLQSSSENSTESQAAAETLASKLTVLSGALSHMQTKAVVTHMFETALRSTHTMSNSSHLSESDKNALNTLVDACIIKEKYEKLKLPNFPSDILQDRRLFDGHNFAAAYFLLQMVEVVTACGITPIEIR